MNQKNKISSKELLNEFIEKNEKYMEVIEFTTKSVWHTYSTLKSYIDKHKEQEQNYKKIELMVVKGHLILKNNSL